MKSRNETPTLAETNIRPARVLTHDQHSFLGDGRRQFLICGEIHYARAPRAEWDGILDRSLECGINTIASYVFWNWHEPQRDVYDFSGDRDLGHFLDLCGARGLNVFLRLGPYCCAEWNHGGIRRISGTSRACASARSTSPTCAGCRSASSTWPPRCARALRREEERLELYNLREDIGETRSLALERPAITRGLHDKLVAWRQSIEAKIPQRNPDWKKNEAGHPAPPPLINP